MEVANTGSSVYTSLPDGSDHAARAEDVDVEGAPAHQPAHHFHPSQKLSKIITAVGNFSVQYNFQAIAIALIIMSQEECTSTAANCRQGKQDSWVSAASSSVVFAGAIFGQCGMGYLGDALGRDQAMTITLALASLGAMLSAVLSIDSTQPTFTYVSIVVSRFLLGIGLGGLYPLSATKAAEDGADDEEHEAAGADAGGESVDSTASAKAFFWQVPGAMAPWALAYLFTYCPDLSTDARWRLLLGLGAVPAAAVALLSYIETRAKEKLRDNQLSMLLLGGQGDKWVLSALQGLQGQGVHHPSASIDRQLRAEALGGGDVTSRLSLRLSQASIASADLMQSRELRNSAVGIGLINTNTLLLDRLQQWEYQSKLLATGGGWFLYDVAFYGVNLFGGSILEAINNSTDDNVSSVNNVRLVAGQELLAMSMGIPACILTIVLLKRVGTKALQVWGFVLIAAMFVLLAALFAPLKYSSPQGLFAVYCALLFSLSFGPNVTTYVLPAETYPKEIRATFNGISAAMGKLGAVVGASLFKVIAESTSYPFIMLLCAALSVFGALLSWRFVQASR